MLELGLEGKVALVKGKRLVTTLGESEHRIRRNLKLVVFREGAPITDPDDESIIIQEADTEILAEALLTNVKPTSSDAQILVRTEVYQTEDIERGHLVVTK